MNSIITLRPGIFSKHRGRVLVSYLLDSVLPSQKYSQLDGHSNRWESREIARTFVKLGYVTDVVNWDNFQFIPSKKYDIIFDIYTRFHDWQDIIPKDTIKLLHLTGSYPSYQNNAEQKEAKKFEKRTKIKYNLTRQVLNPSGAIKAIRNSDHCSLLGNDHTLNTYPLSLHSKISLLPVTASRVNYVKNDNYVPNRNSFLWFFGSGAVHKGLDKVVEVFLRNSKFQLHIIGNVGVDNPFWSAYGTKISLSQNITYHGYLSPVDAKFREIVDKTFCFIAPSCSESMSTSVATCLQVGLYPLISRDTGITLPKGCGKYLKSLSIQDISNGISEILDLSKYRITKEIKSIQNYAGYTYSRKNFTINMYNYIKDNIYEYGV